MKIPKQLGQQTSRQSWIFASLIATLLLLASQSLAAQENKIAAMASIVSYLLDEDKEVARVGIIAFAHANQPTSASYSVTTKYNRGGGTVIGKRISKGNYLIEFNGSNFSKPRVNFQVSAIGSSASCSLGQWEQSKISVFCYDRSGSSFDSQYTITISEVGAKSSATTIIYGVAGDPLSTDPYSLYGPTSYGIGFSSPNSIRTAVGQYTVTAYNVSMESSIIHVGALDGQDAVCNAHSWVRFSIDIRCYDSSGEATNATFAVVAIQVINFGDGIPRETAAFVFGTQPSTALYLPQIQHYYNAGNQSVKIFRLSIGQYLIEFRGLDNEPGNEIGLPLATSASVNSNCLIESWDRAAAVVRCRTPVGLPVDSRFLLQYFRKE